MRLQVVMKEKELDEVRAAAEQRRMTVSAWVRLVLREERERTRRGQAPVVREPGKRYGGVRAGPTARVRVELDVKEDLLDAVRTRYHLTSRRAAIEFALRRAAVKPMSKEEALAMEGVGWGGDIEEMRSGDAGEPW
jgi:Arc/MetJ family transcription regulator